MTIMAFIHERVPDQDTVATELQYYLGDIQGLMDKEYSNGQYGIQTILDNR